MLIATFAEAQPSRRLKQRFEEAGIKAEVCDDSILQRLVFWTRPYATKRVCVEDMDFYRARALLTEWEKSEHILEEAIRCPECNSPRIEYPQFTRKFATPLIIEWLVSLGAGEKDFYCADCHFTWPREIKLRQEMDILGFPKRRIKPRFSR